MVESLWFGGHIEVFFDGYLLTTCFFVLATSRVPPPPRTLVPSPWFAPWRFAHSSVLGRGSTSSPESLHPLMLGLSSASPWKSGLAGGKDNAGDRVLAPIAVDLVSGRYELDLLHLVWNSLALQPPLVLLSLNTPVFLDCFLNYYFESVFFFK